MQINGPDIMVRHAIFILTQAGISFTLSPRIQLQNEGVIVLAPESHQPRTSREYSLFVIQVYIFKYCTFPRLCPRMLYNSPDDTRILA